MPLSLVRRKDLFEIPSRSSEWMHENTEISEYGFYECVADSV